MTGWIAVQRGVKIDYDLENSPLQIRINSQVGSNEQVTVPFFTAGEDQVGGVYLYFASPPQYYLGFCISSWTNFPTALPSETDMIWTVTLTRTSGTVRLIIHCNNKELVNIVMSDNSCSESNWNEKWSHDVEKIRFSSSSKASDYYRPGKYPKI